MLLLDQVQDPQNLGACFRSAAAFGVDAIIIPERNSVGLTPTVIKVASGACALVPLIKVTNLVRAIQTLQQHDFWAYATSEFADKTIESASFDRSVAWVMGGEGRGVRPLVAKRCDAYYSIPVSSAFTTLNVATAAGICLQHTFSAHRRFSSS